MSTIVAKEKLTLFFVVIVSNWIAKEWLFANYTWQKSVYPIKIGNQERGIYDVSDVNLASIWCK